MTMTSGRMLQIPQNRLDAPVGGGSFEWDLGEYDATIVDVQTNDFGVVALNGDKYAGYDSTDVSRYSIHFGECQPLEDQKDPGGQRVFMDVTLRDGEREIFDLTPEDFENDIEYWQLRNSAVMLGKLAAAMGQDLDDQFIEDLTEGRFNNASNASVTITIGRLVGKNKRPNVTDIT